MAHHVLLGSLMALPRSLILTLAWVGLLCAVGLTGLASQVSASETITAIASVKSAGGTSLVTPLTVVIERFATDRERETLLRAARTGMPAAQAHLAKNDDVGVVQLGAQRTPIKYAFVRTTDTGRLITIVTAQPIFYLGAGLPQARTKDGVYVGLVILELATPGPGRGELVPAAKIRVNQNDVMVSEDYNSADVVHLSDVAAK
jgi:hypothetical protein